MIYIGIAVLICVLNGLVVYHVGWGRGFEAARETYRKNGFPG
jgi:hypothetical protein